MQLKYYLFVTKEKHVLPPEKRAFFFDDKKYKQSYLFLI